jgi:hypothetical protein
VLVPFMDCLHQFDFFKSHMILVLMRDPKFKDLYLLTNYVRIYNHNCSNKVCF